jgi:hypothetical protein
VGKKSYLDKLRKSHKIDNSATTEARGKNKAQLWSSQILGTCMTSFKGNQI